MIQLFEIHKNTIKPYMNDILLNRKLAFNIQYEKKSLIFFPSYSHGTIKTFCFYKEFVIKVDWNYITPVKSYI